MVYSKDKSSLNFLPKSLRESGLIARQDRVLLSLQVQNGLVKMSFHCLPKRKKKIESIFRSGVVYPLSASGFVTAVWKGKRLGNFKPTPWAGEKRGRRQVGRKVNRVDSKLLEGERRERIIHPQELPGQGSGGENKPPKPWHRWQVRGQVNINGHRGGRRVKTRDWTRAPRAVDSPESGSLLRRGRAGAWKPRSSIIRQKRRPGSQTDSLPFRGQARWQPLSPQYPLRPARRPHKTGDPPPTPPALPYPGCRRWPLTAAAGLRRRRLLRKRAHEPRSRWVWPQPLTPRQAGCLTSFSGSSSFRGRRRAAVTSAPGASISSALRRGRGGRPAPLAGRGGASWEVPPHSPRLRRGSVIRDRRQHPRARRLRCGRRVSQAAAAGPTAEDAGERRCGLPTSPRVVSSRLTDPPLGCQGRDSEKTSGSLPQKASGLTPATRTGLTGSGLGLGTAARQTSGQRLRRAVHGVSRRLGR